MTHKSLKRLRLMATAVLMCVVAITGLAACTPSVDPSPSTSWTDPPWVAEQAAQHEEYRAQLQACLDGLGWHVTVDLGGGIEEPFTQDELSRFRVDEGACRLSMGLSAEGEPATVDDLKVAYAQYLDVRDCLIAHGVEEMGPPQSEDAWLDAVLDTESGKKYLWHPYNDSAFNALTWDEQEALRVLCPQPWLTK